MYMYMHTMYMYMHTIYMYMYIYYSVETIDLHTDIM